MIYKPDLLTVRDRNRFGTKGHSFLIDIDWVICIYVRLVVVRSIVDMGWCQYIKRTDSCEDKRSLFKIKYWLKM